MAYFGCSENFGRKHHKGYINSTMKNKPATENSKLYNITRTIHSLIGEILLNKMSITNEEKVMSTPEYIHLHLTSSLPSEKRASICVPSLAEVEDWLQFAQASEALMDLRCQHTYASQYRTANVSSQNHYTRFCYKQFNK